MHPFEYERCCGIAKSHMLPLSVARCFYLWFARVHSRIGGRMASRAINANYSVRPDPDQKLARSLGWFSIALGATEILAPGLVARISGAPDSERSRAV